MKKLLLIVCLGIGSAMFVNAQIAPLLNKGESGAGIFAGYDLSYDCEGAYGILDYSYKGKLDLSVFLEQSNYNENAPRLLNYDATSMYYATQLTWWALREKPVTNIEVNFGLHAGVEGENSKDYTYIGGSYEGFLGGWVGVMADINFKLPNKWFVEPIYSISYDFGNDNYKELVSLGTYKNTKEAYHSASSNLAVTVGKKLASGNTIYASFYQGMNNYNNNNYYDFGIGYVISLK
jgi:hypothetical protein